VRIRFRLSFSTVAEDAQADGVFPLLSNCRDLSETQILEAFLFVEFLAMTAHALVERELRRAMERKGTEKLYLYPEDSNCKAPAAARVFEVFASVQRHILRQQDGEVIQKFMPELSEAQEEVLDLLGTSVSQFMTGMG
jgi:hypothetical protein